MITAIRRTTKTLWIGTQPNPDDRLQIDVTEPDHIRVKQLVEIGEKVTVTDLRTGRRVTVARASCGLDCACALELIR